MDTDYKEKGKLARDFEIKHNVFLTELARMPLATDKKEEGKKTERWLFFGQYPMRDDFLMEAMQAYKADAYKRFIARMNRDEDREEDSDIASFVSKKEIDPLIFMEAMKQAINSYTKINKSGNSYSFVSCIGQFYNQLAYKEAAVNNLNAMSISDSEIPEKNLCNVTKLVREVNDMMVRAGKKKSPESILNIVRETSKTTCTKKEWEMIYTLVFNPVFSVSINAGTGEDEDSPKLQLVDEKDGIKELEEREAARDMLKVFCENIERKWALIDSGKGLREKKTIQLFFSSNILKELKLDGNKEPYLREPAGDEDFYLILKPQGDFLYGKLLDEKYLQRAFREYPKDFYEVYAKLLREDFKFLDTVIAELTGKGKDRISKERKKYVNLVRALCDFE